MFCAFLFFSCRIRGAELDAGVFGEVTETGLDDEATFLVSFILVSTTVGVFGGATGTKLDGRVFDLFVLSYVVVKNGGVPSLHSSES